MVAQATNRHVKVAVIYAIIYGGLTFFLAVLLVQKFGVAGAGLAIFLSEAVMAFATLPRMLLLAGESFSSWVTGITKPPWFLIRAGVDIVRSHQK